MKSKLTLENYHEVLSEINLFDMKSDLIVNPKTYNMLFGHEEESFSTYGCNVTQSAFVPDDSAYLVDMAKRSIAGSLKRDVEGKENHNKTKSYKILHDRNHYTPKTKRSFLSKISKIPYILYKAFRKGWHIGELADFLKYNYV